MKPRRVQFEPLETRCLLAGDTAMITEFMASNQETIADDFDESTDWIELHNSGEANVDLADWSLTDDPSELRQWVFPNPTVIAPGEYMIVWASGRDRTLGDSPYHTNFRLRSSGDFIGLFNQEGSLVSSFGDGVDFPTQFADVSYGIGNDLPVSRYFADPTPGGPNSSQSVAGFVADTKFSVDRGFYDESFVLEISSTTPAATLVYTLDGSTPTATHGSKVQTNGQNSPTATISVNGTSTVRAMAYRDDWKSTNVDTQTYVFLEQVIRQTGDGLPNTWGHAGADYEMDPEVVNDPQYRDQIIGGLKSLPTLSLVTEIDNWFGRNGAGIYPSGSGSPRPVSAELILGDGSNAFQVDASVEIQGGSSTNRWKSDKLSMQLKFKREFGAANLNYPLFGEAATDKFDTLVLDARLNQAWHYGGGSSPTSQRTRAQYTRDQFVADLQNQLGGRAPNGQWLHVYLNGIYWGIHNLHERPDEHFAAAYFGGNDDDYDVIKHNRDVVNGRFNNYRSLLNAVNTDLSSDANYHRVEDMLEVDEFISYMLVNFYVGNVDWAHHNWYATFNRVAEDGRWRFHSWDAEHVLRDLSHDSTGRDDANGPTHIHRQLMENDAYRLRFIDAVQRTLFNDGLLTPENAAEMYQHRLDAVYEAVVPESARWGDNQRRNPYTRDLEWVNERDRLLKDYFPNRSDRVVSQLRNQGFYHRFDAPQFNVVSGSVPDGFEASIRTDSGVAYYTTDGNDPRDTNSQQRYSQPIRVDQPLTIKVRSLVGGEWSALVEVSLVPEVATLVGDFSGDGSIHALDIDQLFLAIRAQSTDPIFDLDEDGDLDQSDADYWIVELANTRPGDADLNGSVTFADFLIISANFGSTDASWSKGDFTGDGTVRFEDFLFLSNNFGFARQLDELASRT